MHEHQGPFMAVVDLLKNRLCNTFPLYLLPPFSQVVVPKLVTVEKVDERRNDNTACKQLFSDFK